MKAIILTAGIGSRIRPLTDHISKCLLPIGNKTIIELMVDNILACGIGELIVVTGHRAEMTKQFLTRHYPDLPITYVYNDRYRDTNTGYSLLLTRAYVRDDRFVKFDGDVVFEQVILQRLLASTDENCLCIDRHIHLAKEEVKVQLDASNRIVKVGKKLDAQQSHGESIGIEKVGKEAGKLFFEILQDEIVAKKHYQEYYDDSYTTLVQRGIPFHSIGVSDFRWVEVDTHEDYQCAQQMFTTP